MQIDILSSNTLKLTLSRLDMFDLDIKYESLSGKNPETKRLLTHVLKTIRLDNLDRKFGFDFSSDRIFVEAFPRPDGGCMLYVSSLETDNSRRRKVPVKARDTHLSPESPYSYKRESRKTLLIFETRGAKELGGVCRSLCLQKRWERLNFESSLYLCENGGNKYRLLIKEDSSKQLLISGIAKEYGELICGEREFIYTKEYYKAIIEEDAAERIAELL
ncbi:MAG: adaptor protein MecA [Oscillospiraceae bacterium]|nr:adaptor protein MecA [Oscillospiraceae bacterium]